MLLVAVLLALGVFVVQLMMNRPDEGMFAWVRDAFTNKEDADPDVEPIDVGLEQFLAEAPEAPAELDLDLLVRR